MRWIEQLLARHNVDSPAALGNLRRGNGARDHPETGAARSIARRLSTPAPWTLVEEPIVNKRIARLEQLQQIIAQRAKPRTASDRKPDFIVGQTKAYRSDQPKAV